jgi:hypothetical protein
MGFGRNESMGDGARGNVKQYKERYKHRVIYYGRVEDIADDGTLRLKVRIKGIDDKFPIIKNSQVVDDIPWAHCFLPRTFVVCPQVGETVQIILMDSNNPFAERLWIGPIISQPDKIKRDPHFYTSRAGRDGSLIKLDTSYNTLPEALGIYPEINDDGGTDDVSLIGRDNADIVLRQEEVLIRAAKHKIDDPLRLNRKNPAYINIRLLKPSDLEKKEETNKTAKELNLEEDRTDTTVVSSKIFLIGRDSNSKIIKPIFTKEEHLELEDKLHPIVYGDVLLEFMELFQNWMISHVHEGDRLGTDLSGDTNKLRNWFRDRLPSLISRNIWAGGDIPVKAGRQLPGDEDNNTT